MNFLRVDNIKTTAEPGLEPITTEEAKDHLRVTSSDEDTYIDTLITAARQYCERFQHQRYIQTTLEVYLHTMPALGQSIKLPFLPVLSVDSVVIGQKEAENVTVGSDYYDTDLVGGFIKLNSDFSENVNYDDTDFPGYNLLTITYKAGYGTLASNVPANVKQAIKIIIGHLYEHREEATDGREIKEIPLGARALLMQERNF